MRSAAFVGPLLVTVLSTALAIASPSTSTAAPSKSASPNPGKTASAASATRRCPKNTIQAVRQGEVFHIPAKDRHGRLPLDSLKSFERLMRQGESTHPPDPRLIALISVVSNHFDGRRIEVVSGYRAYSPTQYTPHSNHNYGKALDFRVEGVKNEDLWSFCRTLRNVGCGYYPNSTFVHLDVRETKAQWIDRSRPGEPPLYDHPGARADEGTSDVPEASLAGEVTMGESTPPGSSPTQTVRTPDKRGN